MKISVFGAGYVGLVTATCLAELGNQVICCDIDEKKIEALNQGIIPIYEIGLSDLVHKNLKTGTLHFTSSVSHSVQSSSILFIAVGTPQGSDGKADLSFVTSLASQIGEYINEDKIIVNKSTVPIGTGSLVKDTVLASAGAHTSKFNVEVISNPEFLREGSAVRDFMEPERVVIGGECKTSMKTVAELYMPIARGEGKIIFMDTLSSELTKYAVNSFLALKITYINEIARLCDITGANVDMVKEGIGSDSRVGRKFLNPGIGYGGSCFPKDVKALIGSSKDFNYNFELLQATDRKNESQPEYIVQKILKYYGDQIGGKNFAIWGVSFKPDTDDMREAPSLKIIPKLLEHGVNLKIHDPIALQNSKNIFKNTVKYCENQYEASEGSDALVILTEWNDFRRPDFAKLQDRLKDKVIFDGRNIFDLQYIKSQKLNYISIGRPDIIL